MKRLAAVILVLLVGLLVSCGDNEPKQVIVYQAQPSAKQIQREEREREQVRQKMQDQRECIRDCVRRASSDDAARECSKWCGY